jgi:hypothetical protein
VPFHLWQPGKPARPTLNRAHGLCSGLVFASAPGWTNGRGQGATPIGELEDVRNHRGVWNAAVNNHSPWEGGLGQGGRSVDNGDGTFTSAPEFLLNAGDTRWDIANCATFAVLVRPDVLSADTSIPIFKRRNQPYGATDAGWMFAAGAGNSYQFQYSDGVGSRTVGAGSTVQNTIRADLLICVMQPTTSTLYINGKSEVTVSGAARAMGNPSGTPIKFIGLGTAAAGQPNYSGQVAVGYVWNRAITQGEINALYSDPFLPYRQSFFDDDLAGIEQLVEHMGPEGDVQQLPPDTFGDDSANVALQSFLLSF